VARQKGYKGRTHGEHIENKLGTYGEVCVRERDRRRQEERDRKRLWSNLKCKIKPQIM
jgi:hypothetical protein